jgi:hypothetical protein
MNITRLDPINAPSNVCPADELTSVVVLCVRLDAPHSNTVRNCVLAGEPALTSSDAYGSQSGA